MVHGDLKPAHLLVARPSKAAAEPVVKITDFGTARVAPPAALAQTPAPGGGGSADYGAPELATRPASAGPRADLYSLGGVLYFLLTGRSPFPGGTAEEKIRRHLWEPPAPLEAFRPDVPPQVAALVYQLLAKIPDHRPESAAAVADHLAAAVATPADMVSFELPPARGGQYSFGGGQLSGAMSGRHQVPADPAPHPGVRSAARPAPEPLSLDDCDHREDDTAPWQAFTVADDDEESGGREARASRYRGPDAGSGLGVWLMVGVVGLLASCVAAIAAVVNTGGK
jgi:serine/threonine protein kinase